MNPKHKYIEKKTINHIGLYKLMVGGYEDLSKPVILNRNKKKIVTEC